MSTEDDYPVSMRPLPRALAEAGFDGDLTFMAAFDQRQAGQGIGGLDIEFWLRGPKGEDGRAVGAVTWRLSTGCFLPDTQTEWLDTFRENGNKPAPGPVVWHSPDPGHVSHPALDCRLLGIGRACYADAGYLIGDEAYAALVSGGEEALWLFLGEMYQSRFGKGTGR